jgi:hypothetical protein
MSHSTLHYFGLSFTCFVVRVSGFHWKNQAKLKKNLSRKKHLMWWQSCPPWQSWRDRTWSSSIWPLTMYMVLKIEARKTWKKAQHRGGLSQVLKVTMAHFWLENCNLLKCKFTWRVLDATDRVFTLKAKRTYVMEPEAVTASRTICFHGVHFTMIYRVTLTMATVVISSNFQVIDSIYIGVLRLYLGVSRLLFKAEFSFLIFFF